MTFTAEVTGLGAPSNCTYQWRRNGVALATAKSAALTLSNLKRTDEGTYDLVVKNAHGEAVERAAARISMAMEAKGSAWVED